MGIIGYNGGEYTWYFGSLTTDNRECYKEVRYGIARNTKHPTNQNLERFCDISEQQIKVSKGTYIFSSHLYFKNLKDNAFEMWVIDGYKGTMDIA